MVDVMHRQGINMRYLGLIYQRLLIKDSAEKSEDKAEYLVKGNFKHLRNITEREIVLRSAKHVFNRHLKESSTESSLHMSHSVAHLLNCLFVSSGQV